MKSNNPLTPFDKGDENGFTFIELLAAMTIMSVALIPMMEMLPKVLFISNQVEQVTKSTFLAQMKMEEIKSKVVYDFSQDYSVSATAFLPPDSSYKYVISDNMAAGVKEIALTVWYDKDDDDVIDDNEDEVRLDTKIADRN